MIWLRVNVSVHSYTVAGPRLIHTGLPRVGFVRAVLRLVPGRTAAAAHRRVRNAVFEHFLTVRLESVLGIHVDEVTLRVDPARCFPDLRQCRAKYPSRVTLTASGTLGAQTPDAERFLTVF